MKILYKTQANLNCSGFTLIEVVIVMGLFAIISISIVFFALDISKFQIFLGETLQSEEDIQKVLGIMIPEIRSIALSNNGSYPIAAASSSSFTFYSDLGGDGLTDRIRYFLDGSDFKKGIIVPTSNPVFYDITSEQLTTVASNLTSGNIFYYYDDNYDGLQSSLTIPIDLSKIRLIKVELVVDKNTSNVPSSARINTFVEVRNLRGI